jgi:DNA repair exonuclease SbcCD ATPase subunit
MTYFWLSVVASLLIWGITCAIAFENPVDTFLNKILSDAKTQGAVESQLLESKSEILDAMFETIESSNETLAQVKDLVCNVRTDAKEIRPIKESLEKMKAELSSLKKEFKKIEERTQPPILCPSCGKPLLPDFKICPYCGANIKLLPEKIVSIKDYR